MGRPKAPAGTIANLGKTLRTALLVDGLLHRTKSPWTQIEARVNGQYEDDQAPSKDIVRRYFRLELVPAVDVVRGRPSWPAMVVRCYPTAIDLFFSPLMDLLFGRFASSETAALKQAYYPKEWLDLEKQEDPEGRYRIMKALNQAAHTRRKGRPALEDADRPLRTIHKVVLRTNPNVHSKLFCIGKGGCYRRMRPIADELADLSRVKSLDSLAATYGLLLESVEIADLDRFEAARASLHGRLDVIDELPECRRVADVLKLVLEETIWRPTSIIYDGNGIHKQGLPESWHAVGPDMDIFPLLERFGPADDQLDFYIEKSLTPKEVLSHAERHVVGEPNRFSQKVLKEILSSSDSKLNSWVKRLFLELVKEVRQGTPSICEWSIKGTLALQVQTRVVLLMPLEESVKLIFLDYGFLNGDSVVDRQMLQVPWINASRKWVVQDDEVQATVSEISKHLCIAEDSAIYVQKSRRKKPKANAKKNSGSSGGSVKWVF